MGQYVPYDPLELHYGYNGFLNNFFLRFFIGDVPYSRDPEIIEGNFRRAARWLGDRTFGAGQERNEERSDKLYDQTGLQLIEEIDQTIRELGYTVEMVGMVINTYLHVREHASNEAYWKMTKIIDTFLLPIYIALRNKGYNKQDLWG